MATSCSSWSSMTDIIKMNSVYPVVDAASCLIVFSLFLWSSSQPLDLNPLYLLLKTPNAILPLIFPVFCFLSSISIEVSISCSYVHSSVTSFLPLYLTRFRPCLNFIIISKPFQCYIRVLIILSFPICYLAADVLTWTSSRSSDIFSNSISIKINRTVDYYLV